MPDVASMLCWRTDDPCWCFHRDPFQIFSTWRSLRCCATTFTSLTDRASLAQIETCVAQAKPARPHPSRGAREGGWLIDNLIRAVGTGGGATRHRPAGRYRATRPSLCRSIRTIRSLRRESLLPDTTGKMMHNYFGRPPEFRATQNRHLFPTAS